MTKLGEDFKTKQTIELIIDEKNSGGSFNSSFFYKNPQYVITATPSGSVGSTKASVRLTYNCPENAYGLPILAKPENKSRLNHVNDDINICKGKESRTYSNGAVTIEAKIDYNTPYTVVFSNYKDDMHGHYSAIFESNATLSIQEIMPEGNGLIANQIDVFYYNFIGCLGSIKLWWQYSIIKLF